MSCLSRRPGFRAAVQRTHQRWRRSPRHFGMHREGDTPRKLMDFEQKLIDDRQEVPRDLRHGRAQEDRCRSTTRSSPRTCTIWACSSGATAWAWPSASRTSRWHAGVHVHLGGRRHPAGQLWTPKARPAEAESAETIPVTSNPSSDVGLEWTPPQPRFLRPCVGTARLWDGSATEAHAQLHHSPTDHRLLHADRHRPRFIRRDQAAAGRFCHQLQGVPAAAPASPRKMPSAGQYRARAVRPGSAAADPVLRPGSRAWSPRASSAIRSPTAKTWAS